MVTRILDVLPDLFAHLHASCKARGTPETLERQHHQRGSLGTTSEDWEASSVGMKNNLRTALRRPQVGDAMKLVDKCVKQGSTPYETHIKIQGIKEQHRPFNLGVNHVDDFGIQADQTERMKSLWGGTKPLENGAKGAEFSPCSLDG